MEKFYDGSQEKHNWYVQPVAIIVFCSALIPPPFQTCTSAFLHKNREGRGAGPSGEEDSNTDLIESDDDGLLYFDRVGDGARRGERA
mgnify:CR=1 FL=1